MSKAQSTVTALYREHHGWLHSWLFNRLGCSHNAADLAQDTFLRLLRRRDEAESQRIDEPRAYLRVIAKGLMVDHFRRRSLEQAYLETLAQLPEAVTVSPMEREILLQTLDQIDAMLDQLPARARRVFLMSQLDGMPYADIANTIGISTRTVKRDMRQAFAHCLAMMLET